MLTRKQQSRRTGFTDATYPCSPKNSNPAGPDLWTSESCGLPVAGPRPALSGRAVRLLIDCRAADPFSGSCVGSLYIICSLAAWAEALHTIFVVEVGEQTVFT